MSLELWWMRPEAPYMPIATVGLLSALHDAGVEATTAWRSDAVGEVLHVRCDRTTAQIAQAIIDAPWPDLSRIWKETKVGQAIKPMLKAQDDPAAALADLRRHADRDDRDAARQGGERLLGERRLLRALVTDAVLDGDGVPSRSRLLRGVKGDLSGVADPVKITVSGLAGELERGPEWRNKYSGRGLGLVPEAQTFGGTTGRDPSLVGCHSALLHRLLWLGIMALPPVGVVRHRQRVVGGPLFTDLEKGETVLSWPTWSFPVGARGLARLFDLAAIHAETPEQRWLASRGITSVHRSTSVPLNSMIGAFRWGKRVA